VTQAVESLPVALVVLALWSFQLVRGAVYYLLGRLSRGRPGGRFDAWAHRISKGRIEQAEARMRQVGPKAIIVAYPLYGISAGTQIVAGGLHMRLPVFYLALGAVSLPWATMQAVIGLAAFQAIVAGYTPWVLGVGIVLIALWLLWRHRRLGPAQPTAESVTHAQGVESVAPSTDA
jgi:membrane protein DedA with SNARE-associated domain